MTNRSRGVSKTRWSAIVSSTTPRFGPRCPPVCDKTRINSSRTSCASCGRSCSPNALMSAGEWIPSSNRTGFSAVAVVVVLSEESDVVIFYFFLDHFIIVRRFRRRFKIFNYRFAGIVARDDLDLLLGFGQSVLANVYQIHPFLVAHDQILERQFTALHLFDNFFEPIHRAFEVKLYFTRLRFAAHGANEKLSIG